MFDNATDAVSEVGTDFRPTVRMCNCSLETLKPQGRATVVMMFACKGRMLMVRSKKEDIGGMSPAQEGMEESETVFKTVCRGAGEELKFTKDLLLKGKGKGEKPICVGECRNPIPPEREVGVVVKHLFFVFIPVISDEWVRLNNENTTYEWAESEDQLKALLHPRMKERQVKCFAVLDAAKWLVKNGYFRWAT